MPFPTQHHSAACTRLCYRGCADGPGPSVLLGDEHAQRPTRNCAHAQPSTDNQTLQQHCLHDDCLLYIMREEACERALVVAGRGLAFRGCGGTGNNPLRRCYTGTACPYSLNRDSSSSHTEQSTQARSHRQELTAVERMAFDKLSPELIRAAAITYG